MVKELRSHTPLGAPPNKVNIKEKKTMHNLRLWYWSLQVKLEADNQKG